MTERPTIEELEAQVREALARDAHGRSHEVAALTDLAARAREVEEALERIAIDARSAYGIAEQGGAKEMARAALRALGDKP